MTLKVIFKFYEYIIFDCYLNNLFYVVNNYYSLDLLWISPFAAVAERRKNTKRYCIWLITSFHTSNLPRVESAPATAGSRVVNSATGAI
jgi:hypothetical protein